MNREIKFRAWHDGEMVYDAWPVSSNAYITDGGLEGNVDQLMQYVGLKDKNGKPIFEGDIVRKFGFKGNYVVEYGEYRRPNFMNGDSQKRHLGFYGKPIPYTDPKSEVTWEGSIVSLVGDDFHSGIEVIGNIYEQPELLEVNKED